MFVCSLPVASTHARALDICRGAALNTPQIVFTHGLGHVGQNWQVRWSVGVPLRCLTVVAQISVRAHTRLIPEKLFTHGLGYAGTKLLFEVSNALTMLCAMLSRTMG